MDYTFILNNQKKKSKSKWDGGIVIPMLNLILAPREPILWPPENLRQIGDDRDSRLLAILLISDFLDPNFSNKWTI